ncbi:MAG: hypothetical protein FWD17_12670 [Polyangiaceae bacterium]|nr:hypothetical protein [Polyangiaceae bacterium]
MDCRFGLATALACLAPTACAGPQLVRAEGYCAPPSGALVTIPSEPAKPSASYAERIAALLGASPAFEERPRTESGRLLALERIELARLAIAATGAELECEQDRAEQAAEALQRVKDNQAQALTIGSIGVAAMTSVASALLATRNASAAAQDSVAIGGGVVTAGLALGSLYVHPTVPLQTPRNLLAPLWIGPEPPQVYPTIVWTYLTRPEFSNDRQRSIREHLVDRWRRETGLGEDAGLARLLFGSGGDYDIDALRARVELLGEVEAEVHLESQDLASFAAAMFAEPGT